MSDDFFREEEQKPVVELSIQDQLAAEQLRQLKEPKRKDSWTRHPLFLAVVGFFFTGVVGQILSTNYQRAQQESQKAQAEISAYRVRLAATLDTAAMIVQPISTQLGFLRAYAFPDSSPSRATIAGVRSFAPQMRENVDRQIKGLPNRYAVQERLCVLRMNAIGSQMANIDYSFQMLVFNLSRARSLTDSLRNEVKRLTEYTGHFTFSVDSVVAADIVNNTAEWVPLSLVFSRECRRTVFGEFIR